MGEIEKLLAQLKTEYEQKPDKPDNPSSPPIAPVKKSENIAKNSIDKLLSEIKTDISKSTSPPSHPTPPPVYGSDPTLAAMEKERIARERQAALEAEKQAKLREQRRKEALTRRANEWLKQLDPRSEEGRWFEEFSYSHGSRLEAAIVYLEALGEVER